MDSFVTYSNPLESFSILASVVFFLLFAIIVIFGKLASGEDCYARMNKLHMQMLPGYLLSTVFFAFYTDQLNKYSFIGLLIGSFLYFSLHYVYLFALVGLAKKSISISLLSEIKNTKESERTLNSILNKFVNQKENGAEHIRENRLKQMLILGWAQKEGESFKLTPKGRLFNKMGAFVLNVWNLERL